MNEDKRIYVADLEANGLVEEENGKTERNVFVFYFSNPLQAKFLLTSCLKMKY